MMIRQLRLLLPAAMILLATGGGPLRAQPASYQPGDRVEVDVIMAGAPERGMWRIGTVKAIDSNAREVVIATDAATDNGGRNIGIPFQSAGKWIRRSAQPPPAAPKPPTATAPPSAAPPQAGPPPATNRSPAPEAAPRAPAPPEGILACPVDQAKVAQGSRPDPQVLSKVIRCLFEVRAQSPSERSVKIDIHSLEIGAARDCVPREDFGCGLPVYKIFPALVRWTKTDYYTHSIQWSDNQSVFNCNVDAFGRWACALGRRITDGRLQTKQR